MKVWKTTVKRIKKVPPHVLDEISYARKYLVDLSIYGTFVSVSHRKRAWQTKESGSLPLSLTLGCQQLKIPGLLLCSENRRKKGGSFGSVLHGNRAWRTKELLRKEPYAKVHMTIFATAPSLQEMVSHQLCRGSNLHKDNDGWANCRPVSADLLYITLDT